MKPTNTTKKTRGGARKGSGRPASEPMESIKMPTRLITAAREEKASGRHPGATIVGILSGWTDAGRLAPAPYTREELMKAGHDHVNLEPSPRRILDDQMARDIAASLPTKCSIRVGAIIPFDSGKEAPEGYLRPIGQSLSRSKYPYLFEAIRDQFGARDDKHFTLPDLGCYIIGLKGKKKKICQVVIRSKP